MAGIEKIRVDEGYIDSTSFPATPAPSPFCPSPGQVTVFSPDQIAEGIQRLRFEETAGASALSGASSGQPPTPSTTPGPGNAPPPLVNANLGIIPELLQESIDNLTGILVLFLLYEYGVTLIFFFVSNRCGRGLSQHFQSSNPHSNSTFALAITSIGQRSCQSHCSP